MLVTKAVKLIEEGDQPFRVPHGRDRDGSVERTYAVLNVRKLAPLENVFEAVNEVEPLAGFGHAFSAEVRVKRIKQVSPILLG